jgi:hypothetical protein
MSATDSSVLKRDIKPSQENPEENDATTISQNDDPPSAVLGSSVASRSKPR